MSNVLQFRPSTKDYFNDLQSSENEIEVILIVDHEETRQTVKTALGYNPKGEKNYG